MHVKWENQLAALGTLLQDRMELTFEDVSPRAASILLTLLSRGALPISRTAEIVGISQPTATRLVDGLQNRGLVRREPRAGRVVIVSLTTAGRETAGRFQRARANVARQLAKPLATRERELLAGFVDKILYAAAAGRTAARTTCRYCDHGVCQGDGCPINRRAGEIERLAVVAGSSEE